MFHFSGKARKMKYLPFFCERSEQKCIVILLYTWKIYQSPF
ncbi:MAG: hypothetical protein U5L45_20085 [Saprospiraceae bacterium]|nr:hypothetical protein [Saprospiraceae bacterium]